MISVNRQTRNQTLTHPTRHQAKTTKTRTNPKSSLSAELHSDETERFITGRDESEISSAEQIRRQCGELWLGVDTVGIKLHETRELLSSEPSIQIDDRPDTNKLDGRTFLEAGITRSVSF